LVAEMKSSDNRNTKKPAENKIVNNAFFLEHSERFERSEHLRCQHLGKSLTGGILTFQIARFGSTLVTNAIRKVSQLTKWAAKSLKGSRGSCSPLI